MGRTPMTPPIVIQTTEMMEHRMVEQLRTSAGSLAPGPDWMRTRGWSQTEWQLTREREATVAV
jgi:hypothetical protein